MSATNRGSERDVLDRYYTPQALADAIVASLPTMCGPGFRGIVEPSVGGGAFARSARARWPKATLVGIDADDEACGWKDCNTFVCCDFLSWAPYLHHAKPGLVIGNPPFRHAEAHIRHALSIVAPGGTVCFLLRLAMLEGQARRAFWREHPPTEVLVLSKRPSFTGGSTDSAAYGVFRWTDGAERLPVGWLDWSET